MTHNYASDETPEANLLARWSEAGKRLDRAGEEIRALQSQCDDVARQIAAMDARMSAFSRGRRDGLYAAHDTLTLAGNTEGADIIMSMISAEGLGA